MSNRMPVTLSLSLLLGLAATAAAQQPQRAQPQLPEGAGREMVQAVCSGCHNVNTILGSTGYTRERWHDLIRTMVTLPDDQAAVVTSYLAANFAPRNDRAPKLVSGPTRIEIQEWTAPTLGSRSRDPVEAQDGSIWWVGMWASVAGRLDPRTGEMREYRLPPTARPHSITPGPDGSMWYTGNSNATIGRLDPRTGQVTEYRTQGRDPHSLVWHPNGNLYFTAQGARMIGRLNPATGEVREVPTEANPYGIRVDSKGTVWIAYNGTNKIGAMDPQSMRIRLYDLPEGSRVRRLDLDSNDIVWYGNATLGRVGRLDPATGAIREWETPSGPRSHPYALAVVNDQVWFNESNQRPDALVRFDPKTESFQSWPIPSGYGIVRNMWVTREGNLLIHQTSSNRIGIVRIQDAPTTLNR